METFRNSPLKPWKNEEAAFAYDEAARRLYGPDAYLNLPHLQPNSYSHPPNRFKWTLSKNFISMFPSCCLLNINAQPIVHVIHQRLEELKKNNGALNQSFSSFSSSSFSLSSCESKTDTQPEKSQIDLNEFLQQLGIVREDKEKSFDWDSLIEMNGIGADNQGANAGFHVHDIQEELMWPTSIWNF
ncbi:hypothetical protein SLA2020_162750 [Shorea laevis]